jgi:hypothetical protein
MILLASHIKSVYEVSVMILHHNQIPIHTVLVAYALKLTVKRPFTVRGSSPKISLSASRQGRGNNDWTESYTSIAAKRQRRVHVKADPH